MFYVYGRFIMHKLSIISLHTMTSAFDICQQNDCQFQFSCFDWPTNVNFISFCLYQTWFRFNFSTITLSNFVAFLDIQVSCNDCMATLLIVNTQNNFHFEQINKTVNELCSDDLHHTRVQCALFDICSKKKPFYITAPPVQRPKCCVTYALCFGFL